jgi:O-acetyl-ADP-ribose deacetylase (regulator of RNase III)
MATPVTVEHTTGDLFEGQFDAVAHGVNCAAEMRSGIAVRFRVRYPDMYTRYLDECHDRRLTLGRVLPWRTRHGLWVYNLATQDRPGSDARPYAIAQSLAEGLARAEDQGVRSLGIPRLGAGVGGLTWDEVVPVLEEAAGASRVRVITVTPPA